MRSKALTPEEAYIRLAHLCSGSEQAPLTLERKLLRWGIDDDEAEAILERLKAEGFISERRFAVAFVRDKYRFNGWGPLRLRSELRRLAIPSEFIDEALEELEEEEEHSTYEQVEGLLRKKYRTLPQGLERRKAFDRLMRYGLYRGYEYEEVNEATRTILGEDDE